MGVPIKEQLAHPGNYGGSRRPSDVRYLVIHYTANDGDRARNNASYFQNNVVKASAHYFVDDTTVYRSVPDLRVAWSVGGKKYPNAGKTGGGKLYGVVTNRNSISVELCDTVKNGVYQASEATLARAAALCRELMRKYQIPIDRVFRHFDVTGKHCPSYMVSNKAWAEFKTRLKKEEKPMDNTPAPYAREAVQWATKNGIMTGNQLGDLMLNSPITRQQFVAMLYRYHEKFGKR